MGVRFRPPRHAARGSSYLSCGESCQVETQSRKCCARHGLMGLRSAEKFVPDAIFGLSDEQIARFLGVMYACDGHVYCSDRLAQIGYTTISERLARDVQHLLLRLGHRRDDPDAEASRLRRAPTRSRGRSGSPRRRACAGSASWSQSPARRRSRPRSWSGLMLRPRSTNTDTLPVEIWDDILLAKGERSWADVSEVTGRPRDAQLARRQAQPLARPRRRACRPLPPPPPSRSSATPTSGGTRSSRSSTSAKKRPTTSTCPACGTSSPTTSSSTTARSSPTSPKTWR